MGSNAMMWWLLWTSLGLYGVGFLFFFWVNLNSGPVTIGLAFIRALVWPIWIATGWPEGQRFPMD